MMDSDALRRLASALPPKVREVCATLAEAGHQAVIVGGCVRDVLMKGTPGDWDIASSAPPEEVIRLFKRTVPQGLQHGTVKVLMGKGKENEVEVTTFRGEGAYSDARRPDSVTFGVQLVEDLARRDLTVNAIAYDPARNELIDPFGGQEDIAAKRLRAVGNAVDRFTEDGLRVMRAVRFAAQLEFDLDPETEAGIPPALPSLAKVSRERVCDELRKILKAHEPSRGLRPALRSGILSNIVPEVFLGNRFRPDLAAAQMQDDSPEITQSLQPESAWLARIDRASPDVRLAAMFFPLPSAQAMDVLKRLKFSKHEIDIVGQLLRIANAARVLHLPIQDVRRELSRIDKAKRELAVELWKSERDDIRVHLARTVLDENHPLAAGDLKITGKDLMTELQMEPGPAIGRILERLVDFVIEDPARNAREALLAEAQRCELELAHDPRVPR